MSGGRRLRALGRDVAAAVAVFAIVFAVAYVTGRASVPAFPRALGDVSPVPGVAASDAPSEGEPADYVAEVSVDGLRRELATMEQPAALVAASGAVDGRIVFDQGDTVNSGFSRVEVGETEELAMDLSARFTGADATLSIVAGEVLAGEPKTEGVSVILSTDEAKFFSRAGMCTIELQDLGFTLEQGIGGLYSVPYFEGHLTCVDVPELHSGELVTFLGVFEYRPAGNA